jgi:hypothetical protein
MTPLLEQFLIEAREYVEETARVCSPSNSVLAMRS